MEIERSKCKGKNAKKKKKESEEKRRRKKRLERKGGLEKGNKREGKKITATPEW